MWLGSGEMPESVGYPTLPQDANTVLVNSLRRRKNLVEKNLVERAQQFLVPLLDALVTVA
jgi:hypothetical protein